MPETFDYSQEEFDITDQFKVCSGCAAEADGSPAHTNSHEHECIRCSYLEDVTPPMAADNLGYCGHCHWAVKAEVQEGFYDIEEFLLRHAEFMKWCLENDRMI